MSPHSAMTPEQSRDITKITNHRPTLLNTVEKNLNNSRFHTLMFKQNYISQVRDGLLWCILESIGGRWEQCKAGHDMMRFVDNRFAP